MDFLGLYTSCARSKVPKGRAWDIQNCTVDDGIITIDKRYGSFWSRSGADSADIAYGFGYGIYTENTRFKVAITGSPTGGTWAFTFRGQTCNIGYPSSAADVKTAIEGLSNVNTGDVMVTREGSGTTNFSYYITFTNQFAGQALTTPGDASATGGGLTGGTPVLVMTLDTAGGLQEEYLAVIQKTGDTTSTLYSISGDGLTTTTVSSGLNSSDWFFQQYGNRIYAVNFYQGMFWKTIGGQWSGGSTTVVYPAPTEAMVMASSSTTYPAPPSVSAATLGLGWPAGFTTNLALNPTVEIFSNAALIAARVNTKTTITFAATQDYSHRDWFGVYIQYQTNPGPQFDPSTVRVTLNCSGGAVTPEQYFIYQNSVDNAIIYFSFSNSARSLRASATGFVLTMDVLAFPASAFNYLSVDFYAGNSWLNNDTNTYSLAAGPNLRSFDYAYSYYSTVIQKESPLSDIQQSTIEGGAGGWWVYLTPALAPSPYTANDWIYIYRRSPLTGIWKRVSSLRNTGTPTGYDYWWLNELDDLETFSGAPFGGAANGIQPESIGLWKGSLAVGANRQAWYSGVNQPTSFVESPDSFTPSGDETDDFGRTLYVDQTRSDTPQNIIGEDSVYLPGKRDAYAMVGDFPSKASPPRKMGKSRGCIGPRGSYKFFGGALVAAIDGLWHYKVGRGYSQVDDGTMDPIEVTKEVRGSWNDFIAGVSKTVVVSHLDEIWVWNPSGEYIRFTKNEHWLTGSFHDAPYAAMSVSNQYLRFMDTKGRIMTIDSAYTSDNGTAVEWLYETGLDDIPRTGINAFRIEGDGTPTLTMIRYDGLNANGQEFVYTKDDGKSFLKQARMQPALRYAVRFTGGAADTVETAGPRTQKAPEGMSN